MKMTRLFYRIEDNIFLDQAAFFEMAQEQFINIDQIYDIFRVDQRIENQNLIEV